MIKKGLFVLHEGVASTIFTSQVLEHAVSMRSRGIDLTILTFETFKKNKDFSVMNLAKIRSSYPFLSIKLLYGLNIYLPFSTLLNAVLLLFAICRERNTYSFIHARADYTAFLCLITKPIHRLPVVWDCRGDAVGELQDSLSRKPTFFRFSIGYALLLREEVFSAFNRYFADGVVFVSRELHIMHALTLKTTNYSIIPCPVPEEKFFFDEKIRRISRLQLGLSDNNCVFLYSGSLVAYQGIAEQRDLYRKILTSPNNIILMATTDLVKANELFEEFSLCYSKQFRIISVEYQKMNAIYNAADIAFMLRENKKLNWVSSPTKFGEYCLTGLRVLLNDTVQQASENSNLLGNYLNVKDGGAYMPLQAFQRAAAAEKAKTIYSRNVLSQAYLRLYSSLSGVYPA